VSRIREEDSGEIGWDEGIFEIWGVPYWEAGRGFRGEIGSVCPIGEGVFLFRYPKVNEFKVSAEVFRGRID
jgi:hypothetical protein